MNKLLLASGFVQQLFVLFSQGEPLCGFVQEAALLEKMSSQAHVDSAQQPIDCLLYTTYVGKSDQASQLSQLSQRL